MESFSPVPVALVALSIPLMFVLAGLAAPGRAALVSGVAGSCSALVALGVFVTGKASVLGMRLDGLTSIMLLLVTFLGAVIVGYSRNYLDGEPGRERYFRWLLLTLGAVTTLVASGSVLVIALAWTATSLALHGLLTFYADRPAALVAAHKKFLVSRLADVALALSLWLLYAHVGSFDIDRIDAWLALQRKLPVSMEVAACLLVAAVALRSAQLPFHGWITQVMEAPTPVSALLHAGVVNIGGFVLIRLAPWISRAESALMLLTAVGLVTAIVAALIMTTRVSVKVALAWSTCAQMGFMLVQCGLGLWSLALLHLVAHSLYKAYAFLSAGAAVHEWKVNTFAPSAPCASPGRLALATIVALAAAFFGLTVARPLVGLPPLHGVPAIILTVLLGLSLVVLMNAHSRSDARGTLTTIRRALAVLILYAGWHAVAEHFLPLPDTTSSDARWWLTGLGFAALFAVKSELQWHPRGWLARRLHHWLFSGLYLDELFTRMTFRLWPPRLSLPVGTPRPAIDARAFVSLTTEVIS